jgi:hypothetical protein
MRAILSLVFLTGFTFAVRAGDRAGYWTPPAGSPLRKQIMDTVRIPAEERLGQAVVFKVSALRVQDSWALFVGSAIQPNGNPVDYRKSKPYRRDPRGTKEMIDSGAVDFGGVDALLKREGDHWRIVTINFDASDVHWYDFDQKYGAPHRLVTDPIQ